MYLHAYAALARVHTCATRDATTEPGMAQAPHTHGPYTHAAQIVGEGLAKKTRKDTAGGVQAPHTHALFTHDFAAPACGHTCASHDTTQTPGRAQLPHTHRPYTHVKIIVGKRLAQKTVWRDIAGGEQVCVFSCCDVWWLRCADALVWCCGLRACECASVSQIVLLHTYTRKRMLEFISITDEICFISKVSGLLLCVPEKVLLCRAPPSSIKLSYIGGRWGMNSVVLCGVKPSSGWSRRGGAARARSLRERGRGYELP